MSRPLTAGLVTVLALAAACAAPPEPDMEPTQAWLVPTHNLLGPPGLATIQLQVGMRRAQLETLLGGRPQGVYRPSGSYTTSEGCFPMSHTLLRWRTRRGMLQLSVNARGRLFDAVFLLPGDLYFWDGIPAGWTVEPLGWVPWGTPVSELESRLGPPRSTDGSWHAHGASGPLYSWRLADGRQIHAYVDHDRLGAFVAGLSGAPTARR